MFYQSHVNRNVSQEDTATLFYLVLLYNNAVSVKVTVDFVWFIISKTED